MSSREDQIQARRREAGQKRFAERAFTITHSALGQPGEREHELRFSDGTSFTIMTFFYGDHNGVGSSAEIKFADKVVFKESGGMIVSYVPGEHWEVLFDHLVQRAKQSPRATPPDETRRAAVAELEENARWGL